MKRILILKYLALGNNHLFSSVVKRSVYLHFILVLDRLLGAKEAKGSVLTFLDAHCECTEGWLEPLLNEIALNHKAVVCPIIDVISDDTFEYVTASDMTWGGFNWKLNFRW